MWLEVCNFICKDVAFAQAAEVCVDVVMSVYPSVLPAPHTWSPINNVSCEDNELLALVKIVYGK